MRFYIILEKVILRQNNFFSSHRLYYLSLIQSQYSPKEKDGVVQKFAEELENLIHLIPK